MNASPLIRKKCRSYKNTINKWNPHIYYYRKGYMAPGCNLYTSMDPCGGRH